MLKTFKLATVGATPDARRERLLTIKRAAKKASFKVKLWLDAAGLHIQGPAVMFVKLEKHLPSA